MTEINCTDWHCVFNENNRCKKDMITLARSMMNSLTQKNGVDDLFRCLDKKSKE
jgi:hypothetical protein